MDQNEIGKEKISKNERQFRKEACLAIKKIVGLEDYEWLIQRLAKSKEKETLEAEKSLERARANELRMMSVEDYLFSYLSNAEVGERLKKDIEAGEPEDILRLTNIESKLKFEKTYLDGTMI